MRTEIQGSWLSKARQSILIFIFPSTILTTKSCCHLGPSGKPARTGAYAANRIPFSQLGDRHDLAISHSQFISTEIWRIRLNSSLSVTTWNMLVLWNFFWHHICCVPLMFTENMSDIPPLSECTFQRQKVIIFFWCFYINGNEGSTSIFHS